MNPCVNHGPLFKHLSVLNRATSDRGTKCMLLSKLPIRFKTYIPILTRKTHIPSFLSLLRYRQRSMASEFRLVWVDCEVQLPRTQLTG